MSREPIELTYAGTDGEPGVGITDYGLLLWPPGEQEPVKIADGMREANAAEVVRRWNAYPDLLASLEAVIEAWLTEAAAGDGILEEHGPALDAARDAMKRHAPPPELEDDREPIAEGDHHYYAKPPG